MVSIARSSIAFLTTASLGRCSFLASSFTFTSASAFAFAYDSLSVNRRSFFRAATTTATGFVATSPLWLSPSSSTVGATTACSPSVAAQRAASQTSARGAPQPSTTALSMSPSTLPPVTTGYLNAKDAAALDAELMSTPGFSLEQLMELAGLAVAEAVYQVVPTSATTPTSTPSSSSTTKPKILLVCGPGNNGGDGLVAARHLFHFGYDCTIVYPKRPRESNPHQQHFVNLVTQCQDLNIPVLDTMPNDLQQYDGIVDAIFGFSFHGAPRSPFDEILRQMQDAQQQQQQQQESPSSSTSNAAASSPIIVSVDVPSGWNVDEGDVAGMGFLPDVLISLTTPKYSSKKFVKGRHFIGGRFVPPAIAAKYNIQMPPYPGTSQVMEVAVGESSTQGWEAEYHAYLVEKERAASVNDNGSGNDGDADKGKEEPTKTEEPTWEEQYAAHCAEKEAKLAKEDEERRKKGI